MTLNPLFRETLKAAALGDSEEANRLYDQIPEAEVEQYNMFIVAFFAICLEVRFKNDQSLAAIKAFADEMRYDYRNAEPPVKQLVVEGLIRGMMGEEEVLQEISPADQYRTQLLAIRKIVGQSPEMQTGLTPFLSDAEGLASQWISES
ncbi:hypothetical protein [Glycomyces sp. NRRL B-16210]|uniref:hypothetical protein n=1 Tax=Glycomyces sp. NRRL B-16210 TaxID=1463821 RepID=UPI0004BFC3D0|nr:hypothetical protein [Glycomyces sp. NRRL B-16210]